MTDHGVKLDTLKDCLQFLEWLTDIKRDYVRAQLAGRLQRLLDKKYNTVDRKQIEPALSKFLKDVSNFHKKLCNTADQSKTKPKTAINALNALLECVNKLIAALYFLRYRVDKNYEKVGGGDWENEPVGQVASYAQLGLKSKQYMALATNIDKYLIERDNKEKYGVVPGGFEPSDLKPFHKSTYSPAKNMSIDLGNLLDKNRNTNNYFLDVYSTTVLSTSGADTSNIANAIRLVQDFSRIFAEVDENGFKSHLYSRERCIDFKQIQEHCVDLKKSLDKIFTNKRFSFTGYGRQYEYLNKKTIAKKMASWFKKHLGAVKETLATIEPISSIKNFNRIPKRRTNVPKNVQTELADYFTKYLFRYGFTFHGHDFRNWDNPYEVLKQAWDGVINELKKKGGGLDKLVEILNGVVCKLEKKEEKGKEGNEKNEGGDAEPEPELEDVESEDEKDEDLLDKDNPNVATQIEAVKPVVTEPDVAKSGESPPHTKSSEGAQNQGKKAEGAQNQGKKAEGAQNQGKKAGENSSADPPSSKSTQPSSVQSPDAEASGATGSGGDRSRDGRAGPSDAGQQSGRATQSGSGDGDTRSSSSAGSTPGGGGAGGDGRPSSDSSANTNMCPGNKQPIYLGFDSDKTKYCPRDGKTWYVSEKEMHEKWDEWNRKREVKLEQKKKQEEEKLKKQKEAEEREKHVREMQDALEMEYERARIFNGSNVDIFTRPKLQSDVIDSTAVKLPALNNLHQVIPVIDKGPALNLIEFGSLNTPLTAIQQDEYSKTQSILEAESKTVVARDPQIYIEAPSSTKLYENHDIFIDVPKLPFQDPVYDMDIDDHHANMADVLLDELKPAKVKGFSGLPNTNFDLDFTTDVFKSGGHSPVIPRDPSMKVSPAAPTRNSSGDVSTSSTADTTIPTGTDPGMASGIGDGNKNNRNQVKSMVIDPPIFRVKPTLSSLWNHENMSDGTTFSEVTYKSPTPHYNEDNTTRDKIWEDYKKREILQPLEEKLEAGRRKREDEKRKMQEAIDDHKRQLRESMEIETEILSKHPERPTYPGVKKVEMKRNGWSQFIPVNLKTPNLPPDVPTGNAIPNYRGLTTSTPPQAFTFTGYPLDSKTKTTWHASHLPDHLKTRRFILPQKTYPPSITRVPSDDKHVAKLDPVPPPPPVNLSVEGVTPTVESVFDPGPKLTIDVPQITMRDNNLEFNVNFDDDSTYIINESLPDPVAPSTHAISFTLPPPDPKQSLPPPEDFDKKTMKRPDIELCLSSWATQTPTHGSTNIPETELFPAEAPRTVREMLQWLAGLKSEKHHSTLEKCIKKAFSGLHNESSDLALAVNGSHILPQHAIDTIHLAAVFAGSVLNSIAPKWRENVSSKTVQPRSSDEPDCCALLCRLRDYVYACHHQLEFLKTQCKRDKLSGGWKNDEYGSDIKTSSPLQSFLTDGWDSTFETHLFDPRNLCLKSRVRMGFKKEDLPKTSQQGSVISTILSPSCGGEDPLLTLCSYLNCFTRRTPRTTGELVSYFHHFGIELHDYGQKMLSSLGSSLIKAHIDCPDWDHLGGTDLVAVSGVRGTESLISKHNSNHDNVHPRTLSTLVGCGSDSSNCHPHCTPITHRAYALYSQSFAHTYLSWVVYLPDRLWESLLKLYYDLLKHCGSGKCSSLYSCSTALPLLYLHGFTPPEVGSQPKLTCSQVISKLKEIVDGKPIATLMTAMDNFLYGIREPFIFTLVALWSLAFLIFANTMLYRIDILHIRSHLIRTKTSHLIDVKALLSDNKKMLSLYDVDYFDEDPIGQLGF